MENLSSKNIKANRLVFSVYRTALLSGLFLFVSVVVQAQVGIGTIAPEGSAQLDVSSTTKGLLPPRMTVGQRNAIGTPATGLLIYQTDSTPGYYYYNGSAWVPFVSQGGGAIIPYASGAPIVMTTILGGVVGTTSLVGAGSSFPGVSILGGLLDLTNITNFAFSVPRSGVITSLSAYFSATVGITLVGSTITINAQIYKANGNNSFTAVPGASVSLPGLSTITLGTSTQAVVSGLSIPVVAGDRLVLVFSSTASGLSLVNTVTGYASAGLTIN